MKKLTILAFLFVSFSLFAEEKIEMNYVEDGQFEMGDVLTHSVFIDSFYISKYEITMKKWIEYCDSTGYSFNFDFHVLRKEFPKPINEHLDIPIFAVTWIEAIEFCNWLSAEEDLKPVYEIIIADEKNDVLSVNWDKTANGYRLLTEAEWEYAARGGNEEQLNKDEKLEEIAWYQKNSEFNPHPVGTLKANALGIYDMLGNVSEWCWDFFDIDYYKKSPIINPSGPEKGYAPNYYEYDGWQPIAKVVRGGSWSYPEKWVNSHYRAGVHFYQRNKVGFRVAKSIMIENEK